MNDLIVQDIADVQGDKGLAVWTAEKGLDPILQKIKEEAEAFIPDTSTKKGRDEIASLAYKVSRSKTALDTAGKELVAKLKEQPKLVDAERKRMRDFLDNLKDAVRQPLTEIEEREDNIRQAIIDIQFIVDSLTVDCYVTSNEIEQQYLNELRAIDLSGVIINKKSLADLKEASIAKIEQFLVQKKQEEKLAEEQAKLEAERARVAEEARKLQEAKEQAEREERIRQEAAEAEKAKAEAAIRAAEEAKKAETERLEKEKAQAIEAEKQAKLEAERRKQELAEIKKQEEERKKREAEKLKAEQIAKEQEAARLEAERAAIIRKCADLFVKHGCDEKQAKLILRDILNNKQLFTDFLKIEPRK